ncbi:MAG: TolC family protein, partial [Xanthobacteraceae bacterium]
MAPSVRGKPSWQRFRRALAVVVPIVLALAAVTPRDAVAETMEAALARAYENNPQLNAQRAVVRQTDESVPQALSGYRPTITADATVGREYTNTKNIIPPTQPILPNGAAFGDRGLTTPYSVGATATQTFFNGERTGNSVRAAESKVSAARETLR